MNRRPLPIRLAILIIVPLVARALAANLLPEVFAAPTQSEKKPLDESLSALPDLVAFVVFVALLAEFAASRRSTQAFRIGAEGEERVGRVLDSLSKHGFIALHDIPLRGFGNIDHVVVGPTGVYTVETKNGAGKVRIQRQQLTQGGRRRDGYVEQALRQASAIEDRLDADERTSHLAVCPIICFPRAEISTTFFGSNVVDGVPVVGLRGLRRVIREGSAVIDEETLEAVLEAIDRPASLGRRLPEVDEAPPGSPIGERETAVPTCPCGAGMVLRHRRRDGAPFYGCSRFPRCREIRPVESVGE